MDQTTRLATLKKIITPYVQDEAALAELSGETDFIKDLKINSAHLVDIILDVEDEFDIEIDEDAMEEMLTVQAALDIIDAKLAAE
ncbi:MAG: phosphopantetheine-binding protein [Bacteroidota bacterium]